MCAYDRAALLQLDLAAFDQTPHSGWRTIGDVPGCEVRAADLMASYRGSHEEVSGRDLRSLYWHEAQLRAAANDRGAAIRLMHLARRPPEQTSSVDLEDGLYIDATIAFLSHDEAELRRVREAYARIAPPPGFAEAAERFRLSSGQTLVWPPNLHVIDGFIACFGRSYREAYSQDCQQQPPPR
jgi:hypothetical protein